ncbi:MAG: hypothetical protein H0V88_04630 [Pyrinomonadaceae bacterium]|nr:hypothetical protein [Pyrinomonadaceae bacterium]
MAKTARVSGQVAVGALSGAAKGAVGSLEEAAGMTETRDDQNRQSDDRNGRNE